MQLCKLSFCARATGDDLSFTVKFDNQVIFNQVLGQDTCTIEHTFDDMTDIAHALTMTLANKQSHHTVIDTTGSIIQDRVIEITDLKFDDIVLDHKLLQKAVYEHNFNSTGDLVHEPFYGVMGCNGTVTFEFTSPVYVWLLENM